MEKFVDNNNLLCCFCFVITLFLVDRKVDIIASQSSIYFV